MPEPVPHSPDLPPPNHRIILEGIRNLVKPRMAVDRTMPEREISAARSPQTAQRSGSSCLSSTPYRHARDQGLEFVGWRP
jgi:hypothetical protein